MNSVHKPISVVLKETRQNKGISLEEVYKATKIHPNIVRSLEDGTTLQLPDVYIKSYSKIYAKYLGISEAELGQYFRPLSNKEEKKEKKNVADLFLKTKKEKIKNLASWAYQLRSGLFSWVRPSDFKKIVAITLVVVLIIVAMVQLTSKGKRQKKVSALSTKQEPSQREMPTAKTTTAKYAALKEQNSQKAIVPRPPLSDILRLTIFAQEDVWIQLTQDGRVVFKGSLKKLSSETWQAKESFELRTNNAGALNLELNGKILSPLGRKGQLLRKVAITKEGLKVE